VKASRCASGAYFTWSWRPSVARHGGRGSPPRSCRPSQFGAWRASPTSRSKPFPSLPAPQPVGAGLGRVGAGLEGWSTGPRGPRPGCVEPASHRCPNWGARARPFTPSRSWIRAPDGLRKGGRELAEGSRRGPQTGCGRAMGRHPRRRGRGALASPHPPDRGR
jgi:hypothetical protein